MNIEIEEVKEEKSSVWSEELPFKADAGDAYYFVRRIDRNEVVVMGFGMGKAWLNGVSYEPSEMRSHLFLGPLRPEDTEELLALRGAAEAALKAIGTPIAHPLAQDALRQLRAALHPQQQETKS